MRHEARDLKSLLLLDNQSTIDILCNPKFVNNIRDAKTSMTLASNGGKLQAKQKATLNGFGEVWFDRRAIMNILSFKSLLWKGFNITYVAHPISTFTVTRHDGTTRNFPMYNDRLHYCDLSKELHHTLVQTVKEHTEGFTEKQVKAAKAAVDFQAIIGYPSTQDMIKIIQANQISNCPISADDIKRAQMIYGESVPLLKGKTTRKTPERVVTDYIAVPEQIKRANKHLTISADIFYINRIPFFTSISDNIRLTTTTLLKDRSGKEILKACKTIHTLYKARGFEWHTSLMDGEFQFLQDDLKAMGIHLNITAANEHVPKIEQQIRVIKERVRVTRHSLPFKVLPRQIITAMVSNATFWLNAFPLKGSTSDVISPRTLITGVPIDFKKHCKLPFGAYVQAHQEPSPSSTQEPRTVGAICLGPTGNIQGSYRFLNLQTGKTINRRSWTHLPMPQEVIDRVNELGKADSQAELLTFQDKQGREIGDTIQTLNPDLNPEEEDQEINNDVIAEDETLIEDNSIHEEMNEIAEITENFENDEGTMIDHDPNINILMGNETEHIGINEPIFNPPTENIQTTDTTPLRRSLQARKP